MLGLHLPALAGACRRMPGAQRLPQGLPQRPAARRQAALWVGQACAWHAALQKNTDIQPTHLRSLPVVLPQAAHTRSMGSAGLLAAAPATAPTVPGTTPSARAASASCTSSCRSTQLEWLTPRCCKKRLSWPAPQPRTSAGVGRAAGEGAAPAAGAGCTLHRQQAAQGTAGGLCSRKAISCFAPSIPCTHMQAGSRPAALPYSESSNLATAVPLLGGAKAGTHPPAACCLKYPRGKQPDLVATATVAATRPAPACFTSPATSPSSSAYHASRVAAASACGMSAWPLQQRRDQQQGSQL